MFHNMFALFQLKILTDLPYRKDKSQVTTSTDKQQPVDMLRDSQITVNLVNLKAISSHVPECSCQFVVYATFSSFQRFSSLFPTQNPTQTNDYRVKLTKQSAVKHKVNKLKNYSFDLSVIVI